MRGLFSFEYLKTTNGLGMPCKETDSLSVNKTVTDKPVIPISSFCNVLTTRHTKSEMFSREKFVIYKSDISADYINAYIKSSAS